MSDAKEITPELRQKIEAYKCGDASRLLMSDEEILEEMNSEAVKLRAPKPIVASVASLTNELTFTEELTKQLKNAGLSQREIDLLMSKEGAATIARLLSGSKDTLYPVSIDYSKNLYEMLGAIPNVRLDEAKINPQRFVKRADIKKDLVYAKILIPGVPLTPAQVAAILNAFGFRSATVYEALAFASQHSDKIRGTFLAIPGGNVSDVGPAYFVAMKSDGNCIAVYAHNQNPNTYTNYGAGSPASWDAGTKFLVVVK